MGPGGMGSGGTGTGGLKIPKTLPDKDGKEVPQDYPAPLCEFVVQFAWKPRFEAEGGSLAGGLPTLTEGEESTGDVASGVNASTSAGTGSAAGSNSAAPPAYQSTE